MGFSLKNNGVGSNEKLRMFNFSTLPKNKKIIVIVVAIIVLLLIIGGIRAMFSGSSIDSEAISKDFEQKQQEYKAPPAPPKSEDKFDLNALKNKLKESESNKSDLASNPNPNANENLVALPNIQHSMNVDEKKPSDMIEYLKTIQKEIDFQKKHLAFVFRGDRFIAKSSFKGWWEIEEITPVYIRFYDSEEHYAYNLRFLD